MLVLKISCGFAARRESEWVKLTKAELVANVIQHPVKWRLRPLKKITTQRIWNMSKQVN